MGEFSGMFHALDAHEASMVLTLRIARMQLLRCSFLILYNCVRIMYMHGDIAIWDFSAVT